MRVLILPRSQSAGGANWLVTLADLIALMLCFFVMMFAMSSLDAGKWEAVSRGMRSAMPAADEDRMPTPSVDTAAKPLPVADGLNLDYLGALLSERIRDEALLAEVSIAEREGALVVAMPGGLLFAGTGAILQTEGSRAVRRLAELLANLRNELAVVGYAALPADRGGWSRGLAAASAVTRALQDGGVRAEVRLMSGVAPSGSPGTEAVDRVEILVREDGVR